MASETIVIDVVAQFKNNMGSGMSGATSQVDKFSQSVDKAKDRMKSLSGQNARPTVSLIDKASSALTKVNSGLRSFSGKTFRAGVKIIDYATRPLRSIKNMLFSIKTLAVAIGAGLIGRQVISKPLQLADAYSSAKIGFSTLLGDKQGQKMMDDLDAFARKTPFKTSNTIAQAQKLIAMGWDAKNIVKDMYTIGDAAAATGKGDEGLQRISLALSQIKSKGKLSTEELNQLAEAGISAKRYIAEGLGYGSGDKGIAKMASDLQKGAIGSEAAIQAILNGMKEYKGMMNKTANETVEGLKSQIEDTFEINVFRKWGQGLQDGAKKGFGSIVKFLDANEKRLAKFGDTLKEIGKTLSNWAANKLESTIDKLMKLTERRDFKNASLFGKVKIAWDELIAEPFGEWWDSSGKRKIMEKLKSIGQGMGSGTSTILKGILGLSDADTNIVGDATSLGSSFAEGFSKGFDGKGVADAFGKAFKSGIKALFSGNWLSRLILGYITLNVTSGVFNGLSAAKGLLFGTGASAGAGTGAGIASGGLVGLLGSVSTASGTLTGTGLIGSMAKFGSFLGSGAYSGGGLSAVGGGAAIGAVLGTAGLVKGGTNLYKAAKADTKNDRKLYGTRGATSLGMVGAGAAAGAAIGSFIPVLGTGAGALIGAGIGGLGALWKGNKLADSISGVTKSTKELNDEAEKLAKKDMKKRFGEWSLSADEVSAKVKKIIGEDTIRRVNKFNQSMSELSTVKDTLADKKYTIDYMGAMIKGGSKLSASDINEYKSALEGYASATSDLLTINKKSTRSAFSLLYGDDTKGMANMTKDMEKTYSGLEGKLAKKSKKLNDVIAKAFEDGKITIDEQKKIDEIVSQIQDIQDKVQERVDKISKAEAQASYDLIKEKYSYKDLTPESFQSLIDELNKQNEIDLKGYDDAYIKSKAEIDVEFEEGTISKDKYQKKLKEIEAKWRQGKANTIKTSVEISVGTIKTNYKHQFLGLQTAKQNGSLNNFANDLINSTTSDIHGLKNARWDKKEGKSMLEEAKDSFLKGAGVDLKMQKEMASFYESLKPQEQDLLDLKKSYQDAGEQVPQWIEDSLKDINNIKIMSGDSDSFYNMIGKQIAQQDKTHAEQLLHEGGKDLPKAFADGLKEGLKNVEEDTKSIEMSTNLKLTADKKDIDTSDLDEKTKNVIETLKDKDKITIDKEGNVKIKTKDGKIDTSGLDDDTKKAVEELEKSGIIKINKNGKVTIKAKKVDTKKLDKATTKAAKSLENKGLIKINKKGKVSITKKGGINTKNLDKQTKKAVEELEKAGVLKIDKKGNVTIKANKVDTTDVESKSKKKTKDAVTGKKVNGSADVTMKESSTDTSEPKSKAKSKTKIAVTGLSVNGTVSVSMGLSSLTGIGSIVSSIKDKIKNSIGKINLSGGSKRQFAKGGRLHSPEEIIAGEDGPEMIIPLSGKHRKRGIELWKQAGQEMGIKTYAEGGIVGGGSKIRELMNTANSSSSSVSTSETPQKASGSGKIEVNLGGFTINISGSGNGAVSDIESNADRISSIIADALAEAFQDIPLATE